MTRSGIGRRYGFDADLTGIAACVMLAACAKHDPQRPGDPVAVVQGRSTAAVPDRPAARGIPAAPAPVPKPRPIRTPFADPPLPPELREDRGLAPLPPRPPPSAFDPAHVN